ncbi:MAG: hypothetical protein J1D77_06995 [Muribaculaceae bacterium]|nr:hypothetical protein [Muribaculaceae bacterium]
MIKTYFTTLLAVIFCVAGIKAQIIYSEPAPLQLASQEVTVFFNATGTPLADKPATTKIYAHTGYAINDQPNNWIAAPSWPTNTDKYELNYVSENLWQLYIGNIMEYYGISNPETNVTSLNFVFRTADGNTKTVDLFLPVYSSGLQVFVTSNLSGSIITEETAYVKLTMSTTEPADLQLLVNNQSIATASNATTLSKEYLFPAVGDYTVTGKATANGETVSEDLLLTYLRSSQQVDYPGGTPKMGPVANADGSVTFCLGALEKEQVMIVGSWNNYAYSVDQVMDYQDTENGRYFWTTISGLDPSQMYIYYFNIDGGLYMVGDPYARLVLDPWNDQYIDNNTFPNLPEYPKAQINGLEVPVAVYQGNINDYDWQVEDFQVEDRQNLIIYELLFRDFTGTEGQAKGNGTVRQAIEKFDYILQLGVNAVELLPIMEFNGNISWGYNPNFYFAIDKAYGTPNDYKEFIDLCHQNGIAVILDMVFNQSDGLHPWYQMYSPGKNPYYNLNAPHAYSVLNDWNQGTAQVQEQWQDVLHYWLKEYKFDGFRFDLVKGLGLNSSYANDSESATNAYNKSRVEEMLSLQAAIIEEYPDVIFINENLAGAKEENEMSDTSYELWGNMQMNWANLNFSACQFAMGYQSDSNLNRLYAPDDNRTWGSTVSYLESHDEERLAYKQNEWGVDGVKGNVKVSMQRCASTAAQMLMAPGSHLIWMFSEMGNAQTTKNGGGNNTSPKKVDWALLNEPNHRGLFNNYCQMIEVRMKNPEFFAPDADFTMNCKSANWANGRTIYSKVDGKELLTFINPNVSGENLTFNYEFATPDNEAYKILVKSYDSMPSFDAQAGTVSVAPNCFVIIGSADLEESGVEAIQADSKASTLMAHGDNGKVIVNHADGIVSVYTLDGKIAGQINGQGSIPASPGLYIVKCGSQTLKVIVR